jgi:CRP-like cAMP-binding protein
MTAASIQSLANSGDLTNASGLPNAGGQSEILGKIPPFQDLPDAVLSLMCEHSERRSYSAGQTVFSLGQYDGGEFLVVLSGGLKVSVADGATGAMMIEQVPASGVFGLEIAMSEPDPEMFQQIAVTAEQDSELIVIDAAEFKSLAAGRPSLMRNIAVFLAEQLFAQRFRAISPQSAPERRIYSVLLECVARDAVTGNWRIGKMPKHRELADRAGVDEAAAAAAVAILIQEGVAQRDYPGLIVNDMARLNQLAS